MSDSFLDEGGSSVDILATISRLLPILLIAFLMSGYAFFIGFTIVPAYREYEAVNQTAIVNQGYIDATATSNSVDISLFAFETQIANTETDLTEVTQNFLTDDELNTILVALYSKASNNQVIITSLQTQAAVEAVAGLYTSSLFRLQAEGTITNLMRFLINTQEITLKSVSVSNFSIQQTEAIYTLSMDLTFYIAENAPNTALEQLVVLDLPTPPAALLFLSVPTPTPTLDASLPSNSSDSGQTTSGTSNSIPANPTGNLVCGTAPPTRLRAGETAVVDFNDNGALNLLSAARTGSSSIEVVTVVYDNARLRIINGPICGKWGENDIFYWFVNYNGQTGWAGEATLDDRYLCPETEPECS